MGPVHRSNLGSMGDRNARSHLAAAVLATVVLVAVALVIVVLGVVVAPVGPGPMGPIRASVSAAAPAPAANASTTARFVPVAPVRIVDTRRADIGPFGAVAADTSIDIDIDDLAGLPSGTKVAVAVTITSVGASGPGFVTAWPTSGARPEVSNVNVSAPGVTVANFAIVPVAADGRFTLSPSMTTDLLVDVAGVFVATAGTTSAGRLVPLTPTRLLDTRSGAPVGAGQARELAVIGAAEVPAGATAVAVTVTAVDPGAAGYVTVWPQGQQRPEVSTLNVPTAGATVANLALVPVGASGRISLFAESTTHLLVDVVGYVTGAGAASSNVGLFVAVGPDRQLDTRQPGTRGALLGGYRADVALTLPNGVSATQVSMVAANLTLTGTSAGLYLSAYPARTQRPETSNVNADGPGQSIAAFGLVPLGVDARISVRPSARTDVIIDVAGFFLGTPAPPDPGVAPTEPTAQGGTPIAAFDQKIAEFLTFLAVPGASVAVAKDGRVVYARAYGTADVTTGEPMRVEHHFRIASISKVLTGATVQRLITAGTLKLDQRVWPLLDGRLPLPAGADARARSITVRQLLGHTSGIPAGPDPFFDDAVEVLDSFGSAGPTSCEAAARWTMARPLSWDPGTYYSYANVNFCLLGLVIEQATGKPWQQVVRELVQLPRGVTDMYIGRTYERQPLDVAHVTPAPTAKGGGWFMESIGAAGAWMGTPVDVVRMIDGLDADKPGFDLLTETQLAQMRSRPSTDRGDDLTWYGLALLNYRRGSAFGHTGALEGSRTMTVHESNGITWSIMLNGKISDHQNVLLATMDAALATVPLASWPAYDLSRDLP